MPLVRNRLHLLLLPFAMAGFSLAQPVYNLLLQTPVFLVARQNTALDVWVLVFVLSLLIPLLIAIPAWLTYKKWPAFSAGWGWLVSSLLLTLFFAQLYQQGLGDHWLIFCIAAALSGGIAGWILLFTRWSLLTPILSVFSALFPFWFLLFSPALEHIENHASIDTQRKNLGQPLPDIVFLILDELPLSTLLDENLQIDHSLFPGFARLQSMSDWYINTTTVSDGTVDAVPSILTGKYPKEIASELTVAAQPVNLFTILRQHYQFNVAEAVTRLCPQSLCPRTGSDSSTRVKALLLDITAIYLHRVSPDAWASRLPNVTDNWSGFFAARQVFFPDGWLKHAGAQTIIDRPAYFEAFTNSINKGSSPTLNFLHILFPHGPLAYFPDGKNYGLEWMRGLVAAQWGDTDWGVLSGKQRHFLQVQYADRLINQLLDHMQQQDMLAESVIVLVADHGANFEKNAPRRASSDTNAAAMLRVPMFIKNPGQKSSNLINTRAMTVDILPTLLASLGFSTEAISADGLNLKQTKNTDSRKRVSNSYLTRELQVLDESELEIGHLVAENRTQLKLNSLSDRLWNIGPLDQYRNEVLESVCTLVDSEIIASIQDFSELPGVAAGKSVHAYIAGTFSSQKPLPDASTFIITSNGIIVASGNTWDFNGEPHFFALVEPSYVTQPHWQPRVWLVKNGQCLGG
jgi:hypothetical protein